MYDSTTGFKWASKPFVQMIIYTALIKLAQVYKRLAGVEVKVIETENRLRPVYTGQNIIKDIF